VVEPEGRGMGLRLLERGLAYDLEGTVKLSFPPQGVECEIDVPAPPSLADDDAAARESGDMLQLADA
jgi:hypothetical protein